jgi:hypothetical protein
LLGIHQILLVKFDNRTLNLSCSKQLSDGTCQICSIKWYLIFLLFIFVLFLFIIYIFLNSTSQKTC